jgi:hypothetical protein
MYWADGGWWPAEFDRLGEAWTEPDYWMLIPELPY